MFSTILRVAVAAAFALSAHFAAAQDWPLFRGDVAGSGAMQEDLPVKIDLLWEKRFDETEFLEGPICVDGTIYIGDADGVVRSINLGTGDLNWEKKFEAFLLTTPSFKDGVLYVGDIDGVLRALDAKSGEVKWEFTAQAELETGPNFYKSSLLLTSHDGALYAIDHVTGKEQWRHETEAPIQCGATLAGNLTFLGGCDEFLHVIDVEKGKPEEEPLPLFAPTGSTPSVANGVVYIPTSAGEILAYDPKKREPLWRFSDTNLAEEFKRVSVAVSEGVVVAASRNKRLFALDAKTGEVKWKETLRKRSDASPIIAGKSVFVAAADGRIMRFDLHTGKQTWMMEVKPSIEASPAIADGKLLVASRRGVVYCFGKKSN
ncbi:MAG: PQQ-binding-like beta-propeller repeat protein [Aureliella sp.]